MYVLSYLGVLEFVITYIGGFLGYCLNTSAVESINSAGNIFLGGVMFEYDPYCIKIQM